MGPAVNLRQSTVSRQLLPALVDLLQQQHLLE